MKPLSSFFIYFYFIYKEKDKFRQKHTNYFKNAKKITTKKNVVTVKKLKAGKKYFVKVRAFKKVGNKKIYGNYSTVKKVIVKK